MYIKLLFNLILGYVRVKIQGYYIERFINICTSKKILIWNLKRKDGIELCMNVGINDFRNLKKIAKKTNCKISILSKRGVPFILNRYRKRKIFGVFLIVIFALIYISSKYIWNIQINVKDELVVENVEKDLEELGIKKGVIKNKIDINNIINELRLRRNDIAWVGIDLKGTNVIVNIVKADKSPEIINNSDYCDIVAIKPGIITKVVAQNGTAQITVGDSVEKGDILIAGYMEGKYTDLRYVHSLGTVEAKVLYSETTEVKLNEEIYCESGKKQNKYEIEFNSFNIKLYKNISDFEKYNTETSLKNIKLFNNFYLPICIKKITVKEQIKEKTIDTVEGAIEKGTEELKAKIEEQIENKQNIVDQVIETDELDDKVIIKVTYEVIEEISENKKIE